MLGCVHDAPREPSSRNTVHLCAIMSKANLFLSRDPPGVWYMPSEAHTQIMATSVDLLAQGAAAHGVWHVLMYMLTK